MFSKSVTNTQGIWKRFSNDLFKGRNFLPFPRSFFTADIREATRTRFMKWLMEWIFSKHKEQTRFQSAYRSSGYGRCDPPLKPPKIKKVWYPDAEYMKQYECVTMYPLDDTTCKKPHYKNSIYPDPNMKFKTKFINFGPAHPSAHGVLRMVLELEGENIISANPHVGLLHRGTEKLMEYKTYLQALPYLDRLDYAAPLANEHAYCLAVEKLLGVKVPKRAQYIRMIFAEIMRLTSHQISLSGACLDTGAITPFFWLCEEREKLYEFTERVSGGRMHSAYFRPGGVAFDLPLGFCDDLYDFSRKYPHVIDQMEDVVSDNRIFKQRTVDIGVISAHDAMNLCCSGVNLRATGVKWDLRKTQPYEAYDEIEFDVPIGTKGDAYDRYKCRLTEMRHSIDIIKQCLDQMPTGEVKTDDFKVTPPKRRAMKQGMEELIHHFKYYSQGFSVPAGCTYTAVEAAKGEFACYLVSDGSSRPYRCKLRSGGFPHLQLMKYITPGLLLADVCAILGSIDVVFGEVDR